jgi:hypothetical protein
MYLRGIVTIVVVLVLLLILKHRGIIIQEQDAPAGVVMEEVENGA